MNEKRDKELKAYYSEISKSIVCSKKQKKEFLSQLIGDVNYYLSENPEASVQEIKNCFGSSEDIAKSFVSEYDSVDIKKKLSIKKAVIIAVIIMVLIYAAFVVISLIDVHNEAYGYIEEGVMLMSGIGKEDII
ncbi:MAG: DUF6120 family protein [Acutalibacteraceae bacterium]|nr:DUF6120 family protein [Acutalibacteraceae bacterium]